MALKEFSGELDQPIQQKLIPFTGALDSEIPTAPKRPEIKSIGSGLIDAAKQVGQVIFGDAPSMNDGRALHSLPPEPAKFDFASASRVQRKLDDAREQRKTHGTIGPIVGPAASAGSIARGLATDVATGAQRANAGVDQMLGDLTGLRPYLDAAKRGYAQADLTGAMHTPQFESETAAGIYSGLSSMARQAIPMAASIATRNPGIGLAGMTVPMVPEKYGEYRLRGETPVMSLLGAGSQAGVEYLTEKTPMTSLVNKMGRAGAGQFLTGLLAREVPGEQVATLVQDAIDTAVANPTMTWGEYVASRPSAAYQTLLATLTQGGIMGGVNAGMDRMARQPAQPTAEGMLKLHGWNPAQPLAPVQQPAQQPLAPKMRRAPDNIKLDPVTLPQQDGMPTLEQLVQALQPGATVADDMRAMQPRPPVSVGQKPAGKAPDNVTRFTHSVRPAAERVAQQLRVPVEAVIGQWGLETGWGRSIIPGTNNLGNIKDFSGKGVAATDNMTGSRDKYRAYGSVDEFAGDFSNLIGRGRYRTVPGSKNAASYFGALKAAGYAEDPAYVGKGVSAARMAAAALGKPFDPGHAMQFDGQAQQHGEGRQGTDMQLYGAAQNQQGVEHRPALPDDLKAPDSGPMPIQQGGIDTGASDMFDAILQNRDRSTPGSIQQMQAIAANPDYGRMGYSRDFANGAPVVAGDTLPQEQLGRQDYAVASDGRRIPVQYAVVEAGQVQASNSVDGLPNQSYGDRNVAGLRAIAGNGRIAGVQSAYGAGRAGAYMQELIGDNMHGIDPGVVQRMRQPVLVRVMPQSAVTRDIGDVSNTVGNLSLSAVEQARNDARRLPMESLQFSPDGSMTPETVRQFVRGMPTSEQGAMLDNNGQPTRQAVDRAHAAVFAAAYGNDGLVRLYAQAQDPEARIIMSALAQAAPQMARLEGAGDLDIRELVTQAAEIAVNARRDGRTIQQAAQQLDMAADQGVLPVLDLFAANPRSSRPIAEALQRAAQFAYQEANKPAEDMFGAVPRATRQDVLAQLNEEGGRNGNVTEGQADLGQPAGRQPDAGNAGYQTDDRARPADAGATEAGRPTAGTESAAEPAGAESEGLTSYTPDEIVQRQDEAQRQQAQQERADREAEQRARADREVGEFMLTGSDRAADANPNQGVIFSREADLPRTPAAAIRDAIRKAYGRIIDGLERGGVVTLAQTETDAIEAAAQARAQKRGTDVAEERSKLSQAMQASHAGEDPDIDIRHSELGAIQGFYDPATGKSFLIADALTEQSAAPVLLHEVGIHAAKDGALTQVFDRALTLVNNAPGEFFQRVRDRMESAGETSAEEAAAYLAEEYERDRLNAPNTAKAWVERFVARIRAWLHSKGVLNADRLTEADIAAIARANLKQMAGTNTRGDAPSFSRAGQQQPLQPTNQQYPLQPTNQQQSPTNNPPPAHQHGNMGQFGGGAPWTVDRDVEKDNLIRAMQNNKIDLKRVVDAVLATGKKIADNANPYLADELYIGRVTDGLEQLTERQIKPLLKAISDAGVKPTELEQYLHARHAEERNRQMAKVNNDPFDLDYNMAGMSTREARAIIQRVHAGDKAAEMQRLATMVYALTRATRVRLVQNGLATIDEINAWEGAYKNYVPLMRDTEESGGRAQGYNVKGMESRRALGSQAEAKNILANVVAQAEASIIRAEKARVGRAMLQFAKDNPNPDFWTVNRAPTERAINKDTGLVETRVVPNFKNADNTLVVKVNGEEQYIVFNEKNDRAVALVRNLKNMDVADLNAVTQGLGKINRYVATWVTSRNPFFWITNFARDAQGVVINLQDTAIRGKELSVGAALPKAFGAVTMAEAGKPGNGLMARYYREFSEAGGKTGYIKGYRDSVERMGDITKEIERMGQSANDPRKLGRGLLDVIDSANDVVENGVRLAVFATARQNGVSIDQAASIAKNITVNFNRKGNHTGTLNSLYMFANAGIQGNMRMIQAIKSSRRAQVYAGGLMVAGMMMTALNILLGGDDEETRKKRYELTPEYERERSWILMIPGSDDYVKVPLPIGPHILFNVGRVLVETAMLKDRKALDAAGSLVASTLASINPIGGGLPSKDLKGVAQTLTPSAVRPITDLAVNQNFAGTPIAKEAFGAGGYQKPAYQRTRDKTPGYWKGAAEMLNDWTGGDEVKPGAINTTPEALAYLVKAYTVPGIAQAADKTARAMTTERGEITRLPGVDRFFGRIDEAARDRAAWDRSRSDAQVAGEIKQYLARGERDKATAALIELGGGDEAKGRRIAAMAEARDKQLREINAAKTKARKIDDSERRDAALQRLDARASQINARYMAAINR